MRKPLLSDDSMKAMFDERNSKELVTPHTIQEDVRDFYETHLTELLDACEALDNELETQWDISGHSIPLSKFREVLLKYKP